MACRGTRLFQVQFYGSCGADIILNGILYFASPNTCHYYYYIPCTTPHDNLKNDLYYTTICLKTATLSTMKDDLYPSCRQYHQPMWDRNPVVMKLFVYESEHYCRCCSFSIQRREVSIFWTIKMA